jgi:uncharacterized membrane protein
VVYAFKNPVYLVIGILFVLFGAVLMAGAGAWLGILLVFLGIAMSTFAAYQMGQSSQASKA